MSKVLDRNKELVERDRMAEPMVVATLVLAEQAERVADNLERVIDFIVKADDEIRELMEKPDEHAD